MYTEILWDPSNKNLGSPGARGWRCCCPPGGRQGSPAQVRLQPQMGVQEQFLPERRGLHLFRGAVQVSLPPAVALELSNDAWRETAHSSFLLVSPDQRPESCRPLPAPTLPRPGTRPGPGAAGTGPCPPSPWLRPKTAPFPHSHRRGDSHWWKS